MVNAHSGCGLLFYACTIMAMSIVSANWIVVTFSYVHVQLCSRYATDLEGIVSERTAELETEKQKVSM